MKNVQMGLIYIQGETLWGEKLPRLCDDLSADPETDL